MAEQRLSVIYDGPAVRDGRMDIRELAPSLLAFAEMVHEGQRELFPDDPPVRVDMVAAEDGSIEVVLEVLHVFGGHVSNLLSSRQVSISADLATLVQASVHVINLIKRIGGRTGGDREPGDEPGMTRISYPDGTVIETNQQAVTLYDRTTIRRNARGFVKPVHEEEIEEVRALALGEAAVVRKPDLDAFQVVPDEDEGVVEYAIDLPMSIDTLAFKRGNKWRLSDGSTTYWVAIEDQDFLDRVAQHEESFRAGDRLRVRFVTRQWTEDGELKSEHVVEKVHSHLSARTGQQTQFEAFNVPHLETGPPNDSETLELEGRSDDEED